VLIAIGNSGDASLMPQAVQLLDDPSALVRGAAVWALSRLMPTERFAALARERRPRESEPLVAAEWTAALGPAAA
jgi:epoxyqueuosine reductase